ncbi:hypothetical protein AZSI13_04650 [Azospira sp. I13]|uniref:type II secretion system protein n=1 Tax=Azospira sp. I13 TaxID=1765050 RepID=UPI000D479DC3|nr:type II secretion system protein [Azospira sp. I13]GBG01138.1 hypothetical protein AZSI13_04650 [Azospira sp. I13]
MTCPPRSRVSGFTLAELAIVLVIIALLAGGMLLSLSTQSDMRDSGDTRKQLADINEALLGFAASHSATDGRPYLPCPDTDNDGVEQPRSGSGVCPSQEGILPWVTLGLAQTDSWQNHYRYRVATGFSNGQTGFYLGMPITPANTLRVCDNAACNATILASGLPVVVLSHGKNGLGAISASGAANPVSSDADELENGDGDNDFVSHTPTPGGFDDQVSWISPNILFNRLIAAGRPL